MSLNNKSPLKHDTFRLFSIKLKSQYKCEMQLCIAVTTITKFFGLNDQNPFYSAQ